MDAPIPFDPHRFQSAAAHYRAGRAAYPPALLRRVAIATGLGDAHRVLDLGCGPGPLAIGFAFFAGSVLAIDPEPRMLEEAAAAAQGLAPNVSFHRGSSNDLDASLGTFRLAVMGRSFHWMDRPATLATLDTMIEPSGAVTLFGDERPDVPANAWRAPWREILERYAGDDELHRRRRAGTWLRHEAILLESPFRHLETISIIEHRQRPAESLIEQALSQSSTSRARIGARADTMVQELRDLLGHIAPGGTLDEVVRCNALIARREA
jgi:SAM-dependent methyltransferase